ncbi:helix-turn-helix domain-containing protein [Nonomuraea typhae]|uniref:helix-turn-helix domain-containing protein n=1 Tax=Nonomuraea typhae TaxID=2603600 RepID=UPI0012F8AAB4|nr:helix-turn-helix domain-containing protein [Nonomuraea typhae]
MIRIHLSQGDLGNVRVSARADLRNELLLGAALVAGRAPAGRLAEWRRGALGGLGRGVLPLTTLCRTLHTLPDFYCGHAETDLTVSDESAAHYADRMLRRRFATPYIMALADGSPVALAALNDAVAAFSAAAIVPWESRIASAVSAAGAEIGGRIARLGVTGALNTLHPAISADHTSVSVGTVSDGDLDLDGRILLIQPTSLAVRPAVCVKHLGHLVVHVPAGRDLRQGRPPRALANLLGPQRAAALVTIAANPAITTGELARELGLSPAAASRQAGVLRESELITTERAGKTVHHAVTALGAAMIGVPGGVPSPSTPS